jgi:bifunctional non-homologous end joining protein LigD
LVRAAPFAFVDGLREDAIVADPSTLHGARPAELPPYFSAQLPTLVDEAPEGDRWLHEIKLDGYRFLAWVDRIGQARGVTLRTRRSADWTHKLPTIARALADLPVSTAIFDGEVAVPRPDGTTDFNAIQNALDGRHDAGARYYLFDLVHLDGYNLAGAGVLDRKEVLRQVLAGVPLPLCFNDHVVGAGPAFFKRALELGLEGIISKRVDAPYLAGRSTSWLKTKARSEQEFVVGGFTEPTAVASKGIGGLLLGVYEGEQLVFAGGVGTGFTEATSRELRGALELIERPSSPFGTAVTGQPMARVHWAEPRIVVQVAFSHWTSDGKLRHPSYKGLRVDKAPREVVREVSSSSS